MIRKFIATVMLIGVGFSAHATPFTVTSPTSAGALPAGVTEIGGLVLDLVGTNGTRVVSQLAASSLFVGFAAANPFTIGTQTGFTAAVVAALGGGIAEASVRMTLFDGDTAPGNFDDGDNTLSVGGANFGNFNVVTTQRTNNTGTMEIASAGLGFGNNILSTGFFYSNNAAELATLYNTIAGTGEVSFDLFDVDPFDNFFDFTLGVDGGLVNVGQGPTVGPGPGTPVPAPSTIALLLMGLAGLAISRKVAKA
ncbi:MAG: PEP-CTERM sorting domain-containing protein [Pseudomonadota bacterium]